MAITLHNDWTASHVPDQPDRVRAMPSPRCLESDSCVMRYGRDQLDAIVPLWRTLAESGVAEPFCCPDWIDAYRSVFEPGANIECWAAHDATGFSAALPFVHERTHMFGVPVRKLRSPGRPNMPERFDIVTNQTGRNDAALALWRALSASRDWDVIEMVDLPTDGPGWSMVDRAHDQGFVVGSRISRQTPFIPIPAGTASVDEILASTSPRFRANLRRRMRNLRARGEVRLVRSTVFNELDYARFLALEHQGWKGRNGTSILSDPRATAYYRHLARVASDMDQLTMYSLECAGQPVAMHFGITVGGRYSIPKIACSDAHLEFSPGHLLVLEVLGDLIARGYTEFDFLGDAMPWKMEWTQFVRTHHRAHIFNNTVAGRAAGFVRYDVIPAARRITALTYVSPTTVRAAHVAGQVQ